MERIFTTGIKKYGKEILDTNDLPNEIFHLSFKAYEDKIKKQGLVPKSKNNLFDYPSRIYFSLDKWVATSMSILPGFNRKIIPKDTSDKGKILITVDTTKLPVLVLRPGMPNRKIKWYHDPNNFKSVFTVDSIPPTAIKSIEDVV